MIHEKVSCTCSCADSEQETGVSVCVRACGGRGLVRGIPRVVTRLADG